MHILVFLMRKMIKQEASKSSRIHRFSILLLLALFSFLFYLLAYLIDLQGLDSMIASILTYPILFDCYL